MAMDALKNLVNNIPNWQKRLDDLSGQIERRQAELAAVSPADSKSIETKSLRNKGSTESLKPKDDGPCFITDPDELPAPPFAQVEEEPSTSPEQAPQQLAPTPSPGSINRSMLHKQAREAVVAAHSRARAQIKKRQRSSSVVSTDGVPPAYRTRSMIIVYYDSYVQAFFDELVRYISSSRNLMRKAKMAAKVAQIKRLAELETQDDDDASGEDGSLPDTLPSLRYMSSSRFGPRSAIARTVMGLPGAKNLPQDVYDKLDASLEFVQSTCEHGAHQFLRDANCNEEISKIRTRVGEVLEMAAKELERVVREEPEMAKDTADMGKARTRRPISMRREIPTGQKDVALVAREEPSTLEAIKVGSTAILAPHNLNILEADTDLDDAEDLDMEKMLPKLQYRSTRQMRNAIS